MHTMGARAYARMKTHMFGIRIHDQKPNTRARLTVKHTTGQRAYA